VRGVLFDNNLVGHGEYFLNLFRVKGLFDCWAMLELRLVSLAELGYEDDVEDRVLWNWCQVEGLMLVTANRNSDGSDSLGQTLAESLTPSSIPVLTLANNDRFVRDRQYALVVAETFLDYLVDLSTGDLLGTGRLYLPPHPIA
jgi:hypothetical protein